MKTIKDFTEDIKNKIPQYIERGLEGVFDGSKYENFNFEDTKKAVYHNYEVCGFEKPMVLVAENPLEAQFLFNFVKTLLGNQDSQLRSQLDSQLRGYNYDYLFTLNVYSDSYYNWFEFIRKEFNIKIDKELNNLFQTTFELQRKSGIYSAIFSEALCVVSKYPKKVHRNISNDLHNLDNVAVEWGSFSNETTFECYHVNGRNLPPEVFKKINNNEYTTKEFFKEGNEEVKSTVISYIQEKHGDEGVVDFFRESLKEIDTYVDKKDEEYLKGTSGGMNIGVYTLFKGKINNEDISYVRCYCPSTDRMFFLGVENNHNNAKDAIASLYRVPKKLKGSIKYITRQGERYSTVFDTETSNKLKNKEFSLADLQDTTYLCGDEYFKLLKYEY